MILGFQGLPRFFQFLVFLAFIAGKDTQAHYDTDFTVCTEGKVRRWQ